MENKHDDFTFPIVNFSFTNTNIPAETEYRVYISQLLQTQISAADANATKIRLYCSSVERIATKILRASSR